MAKEIVLTGFVKSHELKLRHQKRLNDELRHWANCEVVVTIERLYATRGLGANALYWAGYVNPIADYTGLSTKIVHALLKQKFLPKQRIEIVDRKTGVVVDEVDLEALTTTTLTKVEFSDYLREIEEWVLDEFHGAVTVGSSEAA